MFIKQYLLAIKEKWKAWLFGFFGFIFTAFTVFGFSDSTLLKSLFFLFAILFFIIASYQVWVVEYKKTEDLKEEIEKLKAEKNLRAVKITFGNGELYTKKLIKSSSIKYIVHIQIENTGNKSNTFRVFADLGLHRPPLPLTLADNIEQTEVFLDRTQTQLIRVAEWETGKDVITLCTPSAHTEGKFLVPTQIHQLKIKVTGIDMKAYNKPFLLLIEHGWLKLEPVENNE